MSTRRAQISSIGFEAAKMGGSAGVVILMTIAASRLLGRKHKKTP
jgi:hypothetical protein